MSEWPSQPVSSFRGRRLPERATPVGYAALIAAYGLALPQPPRLAAIAERHHPTATSEWNLLTPRHRPEATLSGHLVFALKWEGVDLGVLAQLFKVVRPEAISEFVLATPTGAFARRIWYLYEWLTGTSLDIPDPGKVRVVAIVDPKQQFALGRGQVSSRHKILDNLPGTPAFCPVLSQILGEGAVVPMSGHTYPASAANC